MHNSNGHFLFGGLSWSSNSRNYVQLSD